MTINSHTRMLSIALAATALVIPLVVAGRSRPAVAAASVQALVAQAESNTNSVHTLLHQDRISISTPQVSIKVSAHGSEDEVRNREQDFESVSVTSHNSKSKIRTLHYAVDIIFMDGVTYYRASPGSGQWTSRKGMTFADPYTGGWKRGRTTVTFPKNARFTAVATSGGQTHIRATFSTSTTTGTADLWITRGAKPYVVREDEHLRSLKGSTGSERIQISLGPFNTPVVIQAPSTQGTT